MCAESNHRWLHEVGFYADESFDHIEMVGRAGGEFLFGHATKDTGEGVETSVEENERLRNRLAELEAVTADDSVRSDLLAEMLRGVPTWRVRQKRDEGRSDIERIQRDLAVIGRVLAEREAAA